MQKVILPGDKYPFSADITFSSANATSSIIAEEVAATWAVYFLSTTCLCSLLKIHVVSMTAF
jgi:hypothetical protein